MKKQFVLNEIRCRSRSGSSPTGQPCENLVDSHDVNENRKITQGQGSSGHVEIKIIV